jgi:hypothetical protein
MNQPQELTLSRKLLFSATAVLLLLLLLGLLGAAGELLMRSIGPKSDSQRLGIELENSARHYGLRPNVRSTQVSVLVETNSLGFREREYPVERVAGVHRIAVLGDSFTFGVGVEPTSTPSGSRRASTAQRSASKSSPSASAVTTR